MNAAPDVFVYATAATIGLLLVTQVFRKSFDPFAPIWVFLAGYLQVYVVQALSYRSWALGVRGPEIVEAADFRAFWSLLWFLMVYYGPVGRVLARGLPAPPPRWSPLPVVVLAPPLIIWGLICAQLDFREGMSAEESLFRSFPFMMQVAGILLTVTGRDPRNPRPVLTWAGVAVMVAYLLIWMFNGKRSHSLIAVLTGVAAFYLPRLKRPSKPVLLVVAVVGAMSVALAIGWRGNSRYEQSASGFLTYVSEFQPESVLESLNLKERENRSNDPDRPVSFETEEWGGLLLMMDTVPERAEYDYGLPYLRIFSTYIPRIIWPNKPVFGREKWVAAWIAGSEFPRDESFTGPAIGLLGAAQLNGGAVATFFVMTGLALLIRTAYSYFLLHQTSTWAQAFWSATFINAWFMTVNDDPFVWFYYIYAFTTLPVLALLWLYNRFAGPPGEPADAATAAPAGAILAAAAAGRG